MVYHLKVHSKKIVVRQNICNNRYNIGDIHNQDCVTALQLAVSLGIPERVKPQVNDGDETTHDTQDTMYNVHDETNELVDGFESCPSEINVVTMVVLTMIMVRVITWSLTLLIDSQDYQAASVSNRHVYRVEYQIRYHPSEFDPEEWLNDADHTRYSHHGGGNLWNAAECAAEELRELVDECVPEYHVTQEYVSHEDGGSNVGQEIRYGDHFEQEILYGLLFFGVAVKKKRVEDGGDEEENYHQTAEYVV